MTWRKTKWRAIQTMTDNPWRDLAAPTVADSISARRVDHALPWGFFWARNLQNECLLVLRHAAESSPTSRLPHLKGVDMAVSDAEQGRDKMLILRLVDASQRDIFYSLCRDIVESARTADSEKEAVAIALRRTWRWHLLLRGGAVGRLPPDEQKGLIGELIVLERLLLPYLQPDDAVATWLGPTGAPKDFEIGRTAVESKARRGGSTPYVAISSEHQLDASGVDRMYLHVVELEQEQAPDKPAMTLTDVAARCRNAIAERDISAVEVFDGLLTAAGFAWTDDYGDMRWTEGRHGLYIVGDGFPRLTAESCPAGVQNVRYTIDLAECERYRVSTQELVESFRGGRDAN